MNGYDTAFVFVACGAREHIDTLHFSLHALQRFSEHAIFVVTDSARNEIPVVHDSIVDVPTPAHLDNHRASIYLKTGLHRILPEGPLYCYLDTDVVALSKDVDAIFRQFMPPVTFAPDHCTLDRFSPAAVQCGCLEEQQGLMQLFHTAVGEADSLRPEYEGKMAEIDALVADSKRSKLKYLFHRLRYLWPSAFYRLGDYRLHKTSGHWFDSDGNDLELKYGTTGIVERHTGLRWSPHHSDYLRADGSPLSDLRCTHLHAQIAADLGIDVAQTDWQHWNEGVFLFGAGSSRFLDDWHSSTMLAFGLPMWRVRDQGTLAATAWKHGLMRHPMLHQRFNLIADPLGQKWRYLGGLNFEMGSGETVAPALIHIYHRFFDRSWKVWEDVEGHLTSTGRT